MFGGGVALAVIAAIFAGTAAATTGAPVFYDARLPHPAPETARAFEVSEGGASDSSTEGEGDGAGAADGSATPETSPQPAEPRPTPSTPSEPVTPPSPAVPPGDEAPAPAPIPDDPSADHPAPGGPDSVEPNPDGTMPPPPPEKRRQWLAFQQIVRECMTASGHEYLYWEWWNPKSAKSNRFPPMPADLTSDEYVAWELALYGDSPLGDAYDWQRAGCWGYAVHLTGGTN